MKRFTFRLERLLQIRESAEKEQARALGLAMRDEETQRQAALDGQGRLEEARTQVVASRGRPTLAGTMQNLELAVEQLALQSRALDEAHAKSLERVETERHRFEEAHMAKRVIERLREQRRETWTLELARYEQNLSDETASFLARENRGGSE